MKFNMEQHRQSGMEYVGRMESWAAISAGHENDMNIKENDQTTSRGHKDLQKHAQN